MAALDMQTLDAAIARLPMRLAGPGGVAGVVHEGRILAARAWGYADLETQAPMSTAHRLPLCSISKQFTCMALLGAVRAPEALDADLPNLLPNFDGALPSVRDLCNNQSGLRDYWALTVLHGAKAEQYFPPEAAASVFGRVKTGHFAPGTRYSYSNGNFRLLADLVERATGEAFSHLLSRHVFGPAGMARATLAADTRQRLDGVTGYEGGDATGYWPAENGVYWMGDAGIAASLEDMLAYETWIDANRQNPEHLYQQIAAPQHYRDGTVAGYGFGLHQHKLGNDIFTGHGGALRGYRAYRIYSKSARLSVVVMVNHHGDASGAAMSLARAALGIAEPQPSLTSGDWDGAWICEETGLSARIETKRHGVTLRYGTSAETLSESGDRLVSGATEITREGEVLVMRRGAENLATRLLPLAGRGEVDAEAVAGRYYSREVEAELRVEVRDGGVYAIFEGHLGQSRPELMQALGRDLWLISTRRSLDAPAPGDWTLQLRRDPAGRVSSAELGCWLARGIPYQKL